VPVFYLKLDDAVEAVRRLTRRGSPRAGTPVEVPPPRAV